ncbi:unnamed protein product [Musa acuminata subsp. burmannicoides]|uniref:(wild Malaysian banana) hypothetical protein n=1 Tax=Musa acuminata subsp. malaccensis TaxID=214687 RepID=A0A804L7K8_MUSAM|nr:unnamed protein product [Musa acuminata subsp. malaccensis]
MRLEIVAFSNQGKGQNFVLKRCGGVVMTLLSVGIESGGLCYSGYSY